MDDIDVVYKEFLDNQYPKLGTTSKALKRHLAVEKDRKFCKQEIFLILENLQLMSFLFLTKELLIPRHHQ